MTDKFIVTAELIKTSTEDGLVEVHNKIPIGKTYLVDINSIRMEQGYNVIHGVVWEKEIIDIVDDNVVGGWMPTEMLSIQKH